MTDYPAWICWDCGSNHGRVIQGHIATYHRGICGWCGQEADVTEPRDFGYPPEPKDKP